ncbi:DeoR/GlpR family DNA-binding transcription regulator [Brevibacillus fortis]|uniref:DeoR/GlpR transcriptional regulator n=1 Tax=Brevibacillus fortis TaxID=2126352 RepID=A0A2P7VDI2_9BACL|nr:DeoR/GlpR family DNA-binding transcription regulator [Brevibacillus fortis]PSJ97278.1 DeoR/GlpR transcriptional regulator [Brevibacillus fortis]
MLAAERHNKILEQLKSEQSVTVSQLSLALDVSEVTIRKDLIKLENDGLLTRIHGGATITNFLPLERSFTEKLAERSEEKQAIAYQALSHIQPGDTVILGAGTTMMELAKLLRGMNDLTVVTNAVNIAMELNSQGKHHVILIGGEMRHKSFALVGSVAAENLRGLSVFKCFIGADGVHPENGLTTLNLAEAQINQVMMERARKVYVLADHSKFGETHLAKFAGLSDVDRIITDAAAQSFASKYAELGINLELASMQGVSI